ncbi:MAG: GTPase-activating protein [Trichoglossum hirsutum]|nr:MAG: GTPase-activating protein [Trichoglossum hirsutum]
MADEKHSDGGRALVHAESDDDTFEDVPDSPSQQTSHHISPHAATRSLTARRPSSSSTTTTQHASLDPSTVPALPENGEFGASTEDSQPNSDSRPPKSPLLTSHRMSTMSLDDVNLDEAATDHQSPRSRSSTQLSKSPPSLPPRSSTASVVKSQGLSGVLPSMPWGAPPQPPAMKNLPAPPTATRKRSSPFSWLSRNSTPAPKEAPSPPLTAISSATEKKDKRDTASSLATISSNPELMLSRIEDGHESDSSNATNGKPFPRPGRDSLRDRFKLLRMREEAGIISLGDETGGTHSGGGSVLAGLVGRGAGLGLGFASPTSTTDEKEGVHAGQVPQSTSGVASPSSSMLTAANINLPPGTASGASAGPSAMVDPESPVDWDLWQSVVYEGPAAVARTSPEELNRAIASGIPSAIRGVVWQVLAQSKNEELEGVYRDLVARGTEKEKDKASDFGGSATSAPAQVKSDPINGHTNGSGREKESIASSSSSVHSYPSIPSPTINGIASPTASHAERDAETIARLQATLLAEKKRKAKEDALALQKLEKVIRRDLGARTSFSKYAAAAGLQDALFGVCKAYALFDEGVGYAQGINFLAMPLLFNMPEEEAFCLLVRMMNQYHLRELFIQDMPGLHLHLYQFERLLEDLEPGLYCHLHRRGVSPQLYATQWFLTLFAYRFPLQLVLRIYDLLFSEGLEGAILKFGIVLMQKNTETLMKMNDMTALTTFLKERLFDVYIDQAPSTNSLLESGFFGSSGGSDKEIYRADVMVQDACAVKITPEILKRYTTEWEEKVRLEREREAEIESLKSQNTNLALRVRQLEERSEKFDTEHVQVASELVRTKVENEELKDENESLRGQTAELRSLVEKQPAEVESRLKEEMDRIMKRNLEVHNDNQALEEQLSDMEKALVNAKLQYAEINSAHETLKQKWNDLRRALGD